MWTLLQRLAGLTGPAKLGLAAAGVVAIGGAAVLNSRPATPPRGHSPPPAEAPPAETPSPAGDTASGGAGDLAESGLQEGATPVELEVDPEHLEWPDDHSVEISGTTAIDAMDPHATIVVTAPSGRSYELDPVPVAIDGSFQAELNLLESEGDSTLPVGAPDFPRARFEFGRYEVVARSPGGFGTATAHFTTTRYERTEPKEWEGTADALARRTLEITANLKTCLGNMPPSPARDELRDKIDRLEALLRQGGTPYATEGRILALVMEELGNMPDEAVGLDLAIEPLEDALEEWNERAEKVETEKHDTQRCYALDTCDLSDAVAEDVGRLDELMKVLEEPFLLIHKYRQSEALKAALKRYPMLDTVFLNRKLVRAEWGLHGQGGTASGLGSLAAWFSEVRAASAATREYARKELFDPYCRKFEGPVNARMEASFRNQQGKVWWQYEITLHGKLTLRYPETAAGPRRLMSGELTGCASGFKSQEDALRIGWPKLLAGAIMYRTAKEPYSRPGECAPFDLPVKAELKDDEIVITLEPTARKDYGEPRVSFHYVVFAPIAGGLPAHTSFTLPYKNAHFIFTKLIEDLKLPIRREGRILQVAVERSTSSGRGGAKANYSVDLKACNPACPE